MTEEQTPQSTQAPAQPQPGQSPPPPPNEQRSGTGVDGDIARFLTIAFGVLLISVGFSLLGGLSVWRTLDFLHPIRAYWGDIRQVLVGGALLIGGITLIVYRDRLKMRLPSGGKRLYRSRDDKMVSGVLAGLAEYLGTDPTLLRLVFVAVLLLTEFWPLFVAYIVASIVVPVEPEAQGAAGQGQAQ